MTANLSDYFTFDVLFPGSIPNTTFSSRNNDKWRVEYETPDEPYCLSVITGYDLLDPDAQYIDSLTIKEQWTDKTTENPLQQLHQRTLISYSNLGNNFTYSDLINIPLVGFNDRSYPGSDGKSILDGHDNIIGTSLDDIIAGQVGRDTLSGGAGDDTIYAGNGVDHITGGSGKDMLYGGFGPNTFYDLDDGYVDTIYLKSDQFAYNWFYGKAGNSPDARKADYLFGVEKDDRVIIEGVPTSAITVEYGNLYIEVSAYGVVEAFLEKGSLTSSQVNNMDISGSGFLE
jgi:hypothetical protein